MAATGNGGIGRSGDGNQGRVRCPRCGSLQNKHNGKTQDAPVAPPRPLQRFVCEAREARLRGRTARARPGAQFADIVVEEAGRLYAQGSPPTGFSRLEARSPSDHGQRDKAKHGTR